MPISFKHTAASFPSSKRAERRVNYGVKRTWEWYRISVICSHGIVLHRLFLELVKRVDRFYSSLPKTRFKRKNGSFPVLAATDWMNCTIPFSVGEVLPHLANAHVLWNRTGYPAQREHSFVKRNMNERM